MLSDTAAIVIIGDEILSGKFVEENAAYLIPALRELGVSLRRIEVIPDSLEDIAETIRRLSARHDHVFTSGGVGPTHDDMTMEGVARAFGSKLRRHAELEQLLRAFYGGRLTERNLRMADVPDGAALILSDHSFWPVTQVRNVYILPGVPALFRRKFDSIRERFRARPFCATRVYCAAEEGNIAAYLDEVVAAFPQVSIGSYPRFDTPDFRVIVTLESKDAEAVERARKALVTSLPDGIVVRVE
ncbi:MAG: competence/damage-inducible protein A [Deltaproteobacteria bacterium]|nr:competence/damage-inducible protein A [Deltaproteobacteria bacterium]